MVKQVVKLAPQAEKIQNVIITGHHIIYPPNFDFNDVLPINNEWEYKKEVFEDVAGYQVNADWVGITHKDGTNTVIPASEVRRIQTQFVNKE